MHDLKKGGEFFEYLEFHFLAVEKSGDSQDLRVVSGSASSKLAGMQDVSGFMEQVGRNTNYVIHPEEILADNFALLILNEHNVLSPEILETMRALLLRKTTP